MKIDETWSKVVLRVVAFSQGVVAPFQERLVNESGGCSSLPGEAGKRVRGVGAPFQERLVNERRWMLACW